MSKKNAVKIDIHGTLSLGNGAGDLRNKIRSLILEGHKRFVLDLSDTTFVDASGFAEMLASLSEVKKINGEIVVTNPPDKVRAVTQHNKIFSKNIIPEMDAVEIARQFNIKGKVRLH